MNTKRWLAFLSLWLLCLVLGCFAVRSAGIASPSHDALSVLEAQAREAFVQKDYARVMDSYAQYEQQMIEAGYARIQPDLLYNQAVVYYHLGKYGQALARLRQHSLVEPTAQVQDMIQQLSLLVELEAYKTSPNTAFVRGLDNDYVLWEWTHRYTQRRVHMMLILSWSLFFLTALVLFFFRHRRTWRWMMITTTFAAGAMLAFMGYFAYQHYRTAGNTYGVLLSPEALRLEPRHMAPEPGDLAFLEGMTLKRISRSDGWSLVERGDGGRAWVPDHAFYVLLGKDRAQGEVSSR